MPPAEPSLGETVALGLLQGPAELFPISSSAHVGLLPWALGWRHASLPPAARKEVEVALHAGTALTLAVTLRSTPRLGLLAAATAPPALAGLMLERSIEARLGTPPTVAAGLVAGAATMLIADRAAERRTAAGANAADGAWLGLAQALALIPGVSRSGATRTAARARGFARADAAELSREVALSVLAGAATLKGFRLARRRPPLATVSVLAAGAGAAAVSTSVALRAERATQVPLAAFAAYRVALAAAILAAWRRRRTAGIEEEVRGVVGLHSSAPRSLSARARRCGFAHSRKTCVG
jgi:undecaprenyl-diphosphatase